MSLRAISYKGMCNPCYGFVSIVKVAPHRDFEQQPVGIEVHDLLALQGARQPR